MISVVILLLFAIIMFFILGKKSGGTNDDDNKLTIDNFQARATSTKSVNNDKPEKIDATNYNLPNLKYNMSDKSVYWKTADGSYPEKHEYGAYNDWFVKGSAGQWIKYILNESVKITKIRLHLPNVVSETYDGFPSIVTVSGADSANYPDKWTKIVFNKKLKIIKHQIGKTDKYNIEAFIEFDQPYTFKCYVIKVNAINDKTYTQVYIDIYS